MGCVTRVRRANGEMMVIGFQLSTVPAKAGSFFFCLSSLRAFVSSCETNSFDNSDLLASRSLETGNSLLAVGYSYDFQGRMVWKEISR